MYLIYFFLWVIFNGNLTLEIALFGVVIAAVIFAFTCKFADYSIQKEIDNYRNFFKAIRYVIILIIEIAKANLFVMRMILTEKEEPEPALVTFRANLKTPSARAFLANAITLTPGTITVMLEDDKYTVHCLDKSLAPGMDDSVFTEMLADMEQPFEEEKK